MGAALEGSVTLEAVLSVVVGKRVPIAPELAGYLALEIAEARVGREPGELESKLVYVSEEGTVAVVSRGAREGDAEASVRALLARLLEASGSQTPALAAAARRPSRGDLPRVVAELEAALIPVNRAAGRRALGRLAREVKRVTLGVGRNAQSTPPPAPEREPRSARLPQPTPPPRAVREDSPLSRPDAVRLNATADPRLDPTRPLPLPTPPPQRARQALAAAADEPQANDRALDAPRLLLNPSSDAKHTGSSEADEPALSEPAPFEAAVHAPAEPDELDALLNNFGVSGSSGDAHMARELKAIAGLEPTPPPPQAAEIDKLLAAPIVLGAAAREQKHQPRPTSGHDGVMSLLALSANAPEADTLSKPEIRNSKFSDDSLTAPRVQQRSEPAATSTLQSREPAQQEHARPSARSDHFQQPRAPKTARFLMLGLLLAVVLGTLALWAFFPAFFSGRRMPAAGTSGSSFAAPSGSNGASNTANSRVCKAVLVVRGAPEDAEVLVRVGKAPLDIERLPVGARIEFVATAEGFVPRRVVVAADAPWEKLPGQKPRIELPVELPKSHAKAGSIDPWPPSEPGSQVGGKGEPGTVHLLSSPRGAEIWLLAGMGAEARFEPLPCDADVDVLVAGPTTFRKRMKKTAAEIATIPADNIAGSAPAAAITKTITISTGP